MNKLIKIQHHHIKKISSSFKKKKTILNKFKIPKPEWIKIKLPVNLDTIENTKKLIHKHNLNSVCKEAACPNFIKCFNHGVATFMILGTICTRHCPFCNISHGRPDTPNSNEPWILAQTIKDMKLKYVVITSVNRDDLKDGGAHHFVDTINKIREINSNIKIEILVPDFRGCMEYALKIFTNSPPDVFTHNLENVPAIYHEVRPGSNYKLSLKLLARFKEIHPNIPTKSGLMVGLGETTEEIILVMHDLRYHGVTMLTIGQYLQPSQNHLPVKRYVTPQEFQKIKKEAIKLGFQQVMCGPFVRSSYRADLQIKTHLKNIV